MLIFKIKNGFEVSLSDLILDTMVKCSVSKGKDLLDGMALTHTFKSFDGNLDGKTPKALLDGQYIGESTLTSLDI
ncbi:hypothetical protein EUGRSUZ_L00079 [Eucalyptus grandis]|uniref:Uncharacterized protein n=1 Tax=Eucalyptus grandis TaxID=71139 RepID=A0A058ZYB5_EUCGR|nr:hypothetical protein EUGRSUZ_L00079 [Eucalyptus grandis]